MDTFLGQGMAIKGPGKSMLLDYPRITINFNIYSSKVKSPPHFFPTNFSLSIISCFPPFFCVDILFKNLEIIHFH